MDIRYFRGTTRGYPGNASRDGWTSTTTDPRVATLFALEAKRFGSSVVHYIADCSELQDLVTEANVFAAWEKEVVFHIPIRNFGRFIKFSLPGEVVATILRGMDVHFPFLLNKSTMDEWMQQLDPVDDAWVTEFVLKSSQTINDW